MLSSSSVPSVGSTPVVDSQLTNLVAAYAAYVQFYYDVTKFYNTHQARIEFLTACAKQAGDDLKPFLNIHIEHMKQIQNPFNSIVPMYVNGHIDQSILLGHMNALRENLLTGLSSKQHEINLKASIFCQGTYPQIIEHLDMKTTEKLKKIANTTKESIHDALTAFDKFEPMLSDLMSKIKANNEESDQDINAFAIQHQKLKNIDALYKRNWILTIPVYNLLSLKLESLKKDKKNNDKIALINQYLAVIQESINTLRDTEIAPHDLVHNLNGNPLINKSTGIRSGISKVSKAIGALLITHIGIRRLREEKTDNADKAQTNVIAASTHSSAPVATPHLTVDVDLDSDTSDDDEKSFIHMHATPALQEAVAKHREDSKKSASRNTPTPGSTNANTLISESRNRYNPLIKTPTPPLPDSPTAPMPLSVHVAMRQELELVKAQLNTELKAHEESRLRLQELETQNNLHIKEKSELVKNHDKITDEYLKLITTLKQENLNHTSEITRLQKELIRIMADQKNHEEERNTLSQQINKLNNELNDAKIENQRLATLAQSFEAKEAKMVEQNDEFIDGKFEFPQSMKELNDNEFELPAQACNNSPPPANQNHINQVVSNLTQGSWLKVIAISLTTLIGLGLIASGIGSLMGFSLFAGLSFTTGLGTAIAGAILTTIGVGLGYDEVHLSRDLAQLEQSLIVSEPLVGVQVDSSESSIGNPALHAAMQPSMTEALNASSRRAKNSSPSHIGGQSNFFKAEGSNPVNAVPLTQEQVNANTHTQPISSIHNRSTSK